MNESALCERAVRIPASVAIKTVGQTRAHPSTVLVGSAFDVITLCALCV